MKQVVIDYYISCAPKVPVLKQDVVIDCVNWRGERGKRTVQPEALYWGATEWHPEPQWLLKAWDVEKGAMRSFSMQDIITWNPA